MSMYFYDDTDDWPEYQIIKDDIHRLEKEHLEIRKELQEAESAFGSDSSDAVLKARVHGLKKKMKEIEKKLDGSLSLYR
jgi:predicted  nucleic acid-binding Zn-ribbon protein